jgi:hypothetical protein
MVEELLRLTELWRANTVATKPQNERGASSKTRHPYYKHSITVSGPSDGKASPLRWTFVALSRDELHEWLSANCPEEISENV